MRKNKHHAFILADSLIALTIISLGITFTLICHQCLVHQTKQQYINLAAHRIAKEATDELVATQRPVYLRRDELNAIASEKKVVVSLDDQIILEFRK